MWTPEHPRWVLVEKKAPKRAPHHDAKEQIQKRSNPAVVCRIDAGI
jgi:hypothetical protein